MSVAKHSPAPWTYINGNVLDGSNKVIVLIGSSDALIGSGEAKANGNLVAAAPDLRETLWQILYSDVDNHIPDELHKRARAVLSEADGD